MSGSNPSPVAAAPSPVAGAARPSRFKRVLTGTAILAGFGAVLWFTSGGQPPDKEKEPPAPVETAGQIGAPYEGTPRARAQQTAQRATDPGTTATTAPVYVPAPAMAFGGPQEVQQRRSLRAGEDSAQSASAAAEPDPLSRQLRAEDQATAVAYRLPDRDRFLTEGTPLPCVPDAPITSDVAGTFRCRVPEPGVLSDSGNVPLLDGGTWISGRVGEGLRRGQRRLFATMTKISTPDGCQVRIRAPAADALGQAGLDGEIDKHFFERFGGYIGMAFLDAGMQAAVLAASNAVGRRGGFSFYQFQSAGRQGGREAFAEDIAIPSTLYRNQAEPIVVRLTQDVDMRPCYRLRTREAAR